MLRSVMSTIKFALGMPKIYNKMTDCNIGPRKESEREPEKSSSWVNTGPLKPLKNMALMLRKWITMAYITYTLWWQCHIKFEKHSDNRIEINMMARICARSCSHVIVVSSALKQCNGSYIFVRVKLIVFCFALAFELARLHLRSNEQPQPY